jgi:hypothetical protein
MCRGLKPMLPTDSPSVSGRGHATETPCAGQPPRRRKPFARQLLRHRELALGSRRAVGSPTLGSRRASSKTRRMRYGRATMGGWIRTGFFYSHGRLMGHGWSCSCLLLFFTRAIATGLGCFFIGLGPNVDDKHILMVTIVVCR